MGTLRGEREGEVMLIFRCQWKRLGQCDERVQEASPLQSP